MGEIVKYVCKCVTMEATDYVNVASFSIESIVHGHCVYKAIWSSVLGEELKCHCEIGNIHDLYMVSVVKPGTGVVGHVPR